MSILYNKKAWTKVIDDDLGFVETETVYDTEERLEPIDNDRQSTIEVYENDKEIWNNEIK